MNTVLSSYGQLCGCPEILKKSCKFFCRGLDIRVPDIVQADTLHFSVSGPPDHLMLKKGFGAGEYAVVLMEPVEPPCIGFQLVPQKLRYRLPCGYSSVSWEASQRPCRLCADRIC